MEGKRLRAFRRAIIDTEFSTFDEKPRSRKTAAGTRDHACTQQACTGTDLAFEFCFQPCSQPVNALLAGDSGRIGKLGIGNQPLGGCRGGQRHGGALPPFVIILLLGARHDLAFLNATRDCDP